MSPWDEVLNNELLGFQLNERKENMSPPHLVPALLLSTISFILFLFCLSGLLYKLIPLLTWPESKTP
jgi:hypothetical protein